MRQESNLQGREARRVSKPVPSADRIAHPMSGRRGTRTPKATPIAVHRLERRSSSGRMPTKLCHSAVSSQASVTYSILLGGQAALSGQAGVAVYEDGVWKVGLAS